MNDEGTVVAVAAIFSIVLSILIALISFFVFIRLRLRFIGRINDILEKVNLVEARLKRQAYSNLFWNAVGKELGLDISAEKITNERERFSKSLADPSSVGIPRVPGEHYVQAAQDDPNYRTLAVVQDCFLSKKSTSLESSNEPLKTSGEPAKPSTESAKLQDKTQSSGTKGSESGNGAKEAAKKSDKEIADYEALDVLNKDLLPPPPQ